MRNLIIAMIVAWLIHLAYLISLARRQRRLQQEAEELRRIAERLERSSAPPSS
jgi:hypothetical protein